MPRPTEPYFMKQWREWSAMGPPKCCFTCEHYDQNGKCEAYDSVPPVEFVQLQDQCGGWEYEIPF